MELRPCLPQDRLKAIALSKSVFKDNMGEQFPCLFSEANREHMFLAVDGEEVVSMVNYYPATVKIHEAYLRTGSVGSVCTKPEYRGQKLASRLLSMAGEKMLSEGITMMIISGQGGIYSAYGAEFAGNATEWFVPRGTFPTSSALRLSEYHEADFPSLKKVYETEAVRFLRTDAEFPLLVEGQTYPDLHARYPFELILKEGKVVAYAILDLSDDEVDDTLGLKEFGGDRQALIAAFDPLLMKYGRMRMHFATDPHDPMEEELQSSEHRPIHQYASLKIIDFPAFMDALKPYWEAVVPESKNHVTYRTESGTFVLGVGSERMQIHDVVGLTRLVFGFNEPILVNFSGCPEIEKFVRQVFPIPFAWTHNLNYQ